MSEPRLGMNPDAVDALASRLNTHLTALDNVAGAIDAAAWASLNPLSYGLQPGSLIIAPFGVAGVQVAASKVRSASASARELAMRLLNEADQQRAASEGYGASYRNGQVPPVDSNFCKPGRPQSPGFWEGLFGDENGSAADDVISLVDLGVGAGSLYTEAAGVVGKTSTFFKGAGGVFSAFGVFNGAYETTAGLVDGDGFRAADGLITLGLGVAGLAATVALVSNPVGWAIGIAGLAWGAAQLLSGDVPVTKRVTDAASSAIDSVGVFVEDVSRGIASWLGI